MNRRKIWMLLMVLGIMAATTVCYLSMKNTMGQQYAQGKLVFNMIE